MSTSSGMDIGAMVQGTTGIAEIVAGYMATEEASEKLKEHDKRYPKMDIPQAVVAATDLARQESQRTTLPGQSLYEQQIGANTAAGIAQSREVATSASDLLGATTNLYGQQNQAMTNLQIEAARNQAQAKQVYGQQLNTLGSWQQQQYYMNEYYPWVSKKNELQGIQQSGYDMLVGGINTLSASGANMSGSGTAPTTSSSAMTNTQNQGYLQSSQYIQGLEQYNLDSYTNKNTQQTNQNLNSYYEDDWSNFMSSLSGGGK